MAHCPSFSSTVTLVLIVEAVLGDLPQQADDTDRKTLVVMVTGDAANLCDFFFSCFTRANTTIMCTELFCCHPVTISSSLAKLRRSILFYSTTTTYFYSQPRPPVTIISDPSSMPNSKNVLSGDNTVRPHLNFNPVLFHMVPTLATVRD